MITRIECEVRPLAGEQGLWILLCAAGMAAAQPSMIKAQGPFCGPYVAEQVLDGIAANLLSQGYQPSTQPPIWRLPMQAQLRRLNRERGYGQGHRQLYPEA
jgi:phosphoribosylcarboxyaminoimidazole (NCAIR) mutase